LLHKNLDADNHQATLSFYLTGRGQGRNSFKAEKELPVISAGPLTYKNVTTAQETDAKLQSQLHSEKNKLGNGTLSC